VIIVEKRAVIGKIEDGLRRMARVTGLEPIDSTDATSRSGMPSRFYGWPLTG
jgi:hypothetical protein